MDTGTEKQLGNAFELVLYCLDYGTRQPGVLIDFTRGGNHFADELIVRLVLIQTVPYPSVKGKVSTLIGGLGSLISEQGGPFVGKKVRILGAVEQLIDQFFLLFRILVGKECLGRLDRWRRPVISREMRRMKVESEQISEGGMPTALSFVKICLST